MNIKYIKILTTFIYASNNLNNILMNLGDVINKSSEGLILNGKVFKIDELISIKNKLQKQKEFIDRCIIPEIKNQINS